MTKEEEFSCYLCNATYEKDLQLAAELGKTLLERNKELETALKNHQNVIEDQSQEIEYLTKQTAALKEVNTSRIKIYEQLEISIQDLEHSKDVLSRQNAADRKQIKSLHETITMLESRCEEVQASLDRVTAELESEKRRASNAVETGDGGKTNKLTNHVDPVEQHSNEPCAGCSKTLAQLHESKTMNAKDQRAMDDLREQVSLLLQENNYLQEQVDTLQHKDEEIKSIQEELATLEQIRVGNLCKRCLRSTIPTEDCSSADELSLVMTGEEQELAKNLAAALFNSEKTSPVLESLPDNPYRMLVEKYEALLKMQEQQQHWLRQRVEGGFTSTPTSANPKQCMSLHDELQLSGEYYDRKDATDSELEDENETSEQQRCRKSADNDRLHKSTQTEVLAALPGSFLCKISDGNDCQFSIYDDASPVESRFRKTPEYRQLFKEIFAVLKRAAEAKDEGESLPLLDDHLPHLPAYADYPHQPKVPPVTPAREEQPFLPEEATSEVSSTTDPQPELESAAVTPNEGSPPQQQQQPEPEPATEKPNRPDVMAQLMEGVRGGANRATSCGDRRTLAAVHRASPSPSPCHSRSSSKRRTGSKARKKRERLTDSPNRSRERHQQRSSRPVETLSNLEMFEKMAGGGTAEPQALAGRKERPVSMYAFGSGSSAASKEVAKLKILEKSYADVLRMGRKKNNAFGTMGCV